MLWERWEASAPEGHWPLLSFLFREGCCGSWRCRGRSPLAVPFLKEPGSDQEFFSAHSLGLHSIMPFS